MESTTENNQNIDEFHTDNSETKLKDCIKETSKLWRKYHLDYNQSGYIVKMTRKELEMKNDKPMIKVIQRLTEQECNALIDHAFNTKNDYALIVKTLLFTGVRVSELTNIRISDIDFNSRELFISQGKGNKQRIIPLFKFLADELRIYINDRKIGFLFESRLNNKYTTRRIQQIVRKLGQEIGISKPIHPHLFRHTIATFLLNKGLPIDQVQMFLGHEKIETTQIYAKTNPQNLKDSISHIEFRNETDNPQLTYEDSKALRWRTGIKSYDTNK